MFLEISQNSQENTSAGECFLKKLQALACSFIKKETPAQVFSCEFCKICENFFSYRIPPLATCERAVRERDRQADRQTDIQTERQIDKQTEDGCRQI